MGNQLFCAVEIFEQDDSRQTQFAELLLPVPIPKLFTYRVPSAFSDGIRSGQRVIVQFGDRKILTGIVIRLGTTPPKDHEAKYILEILDEFPSVTDVQLRFFEWMAGYYMCTLGEVMNAALPAGLKLSSESMVQRRPEFSFEESDHAFSDKEQMLLRRLSDESLSYTEIAKFLGVKSIYSILKSLSGKNAIVLFEEVKEKYKPRTEKRIRLTTEFNSEEALEKLFATLSSKPKQEAVVLKFLQDVPVLQDGSKNRVGISKRSLLESDLSESSLQTLIKNGVMEEFDQIIPRFHLTGPSEPPKILLSEEQSQAQSQLFQSFEKHDITLLHGITGSGKTEIYINLIRKALDSESQVLYLLPEIALTTQIVQRLQRVFGDSMGVYHSKFSDNERVEVWNGVLNAKLRFVVGVRSSIFLPFDNLGLIIVDEEHDPSYKQHEPAPRYHARDSAMVLAGLHHAKVLLGSATPSVETYYHATQNKYGFVALNKRFGEAQLPEIILSDMAREKRSKTVKGEFSSMMLSAIEEALKKNEQVIIFQNRRGYSPMMNCEDCGWIPKCVNCAVSLTYHQFRHTLLCHYCGYKQPVPEKCPTCTSTRLTTHGYGTEKLEEELHLYFPDAQIERMDLDTTRSKTGYETIIDNFQSGTTNILVGTQMVTKGLDFDNVSLVGVFNADRMMHFPDFRSYERAYQLITQVSGRSGRRNTRGRVVIQTSHPDHPILKNVLQHEFIAFYNREIEDRHENSYPPFTRLIEITVKHIDKKVCRDTANALAHILQDTFTGVRVLGPGEPMISKIRNQFLMTILLKVYRGKADLVQTKSSLQRAVDQVMKEKQFRNSRIVIDVDPV